MKNHDPPGECGNIPEAYFPNPWPTCIANSTFMSGGEYGTLYGFCVLNTNTTATT